ncbi:MAG: DMT family transporter [Pseudomonadota bacterium]
MTQAPTRATSRATTRAQLLVLFGILVILGAGWGITGPLAKLAVSTGYKHFGLIFWQLTIAVAVLGTVTALRGKGMPLTRGTLRVYLMIAFIGTIIPNSVSYASYVHLQSGLMSVLLSLVPMFAFPVALAFGLERFSLGRLAGLALGLGGVALIVLPDASLPEPGLALWVLFALLAPLCYAFEGNLVARFGLAGLDPVQALFGASVLGAAIALPLALATGQFIDPRGPYTVADAAILGSGFVHACVYSTYVWLVGRAGPTFAVQVSYLVTGFGVLWALLLLGEAYSPFLWGALALMFLGMALVQPRPKTAQLQSAEP